MTDTELPVISILIVAKNEAKHIRALLDDIGGQDYPSEKIDLVLVDSMSSDNTLEIMNDFLSGNSEIRGTILQNPKCFLGAGWNIGIRASVGAVILRVDAHARLPQDFLRQNACQIMDGHEIVGGAVLPVQPETMKQKILYSVDASRFGTGVAAFRNPGEPRHLKSLAFAAYSRDVFDRVGLFNENLHRTEDNEMHYRIRNAGYKYYYHPSIRSYRFPRSSWVGMLKQAFGNGMWIGLTLSVEPRCFHIYHFVPLAFVGVLLLAGLWAVFLGNIWPIVVLMGAYALGAAFFSFKAISNFVGYERIGCAVLPLIFLSVHLSYGVGTLVGLLKIPFFLLSTSQKSSDS